MNNMGEYLEAISIGILVASFFLNTRRGLKAIELCKECLLLLKGKPGLTGHKLSHLFYKKIYLIMANASSLNSDNTNAIKYVEKLVQICSECGERLDECRLSIKLAGTYLSQKRYLNAKHLYEKALHFGIDILSRVDEAWCYGKLGAVYQSIGEYEKGREHLEKSLAIYK